jgi:hypothetical protein
VRIGVSGAAILVPFSFYSTKVTPTAPHTCDRHFEADSPAMLQARVAPLPHRWAPARPAMHVRSQWPTLLAQHSSVIGILFAAFVFYGTGFAFDRWQSRTIGAGGASADELSQSRPAEPDNAPRAQLCPAPAATTCSFTTTASSRCPYPRAGSACHPRLLVCAQICWQGVGTGTGTYSGSNGVNASINFPFDTECAGIDIKCKV